MIDVLREPVPDLVTIRPWIMAADPPNESNANLNMVEITETRWMSSKLQ
jgi:hypothetical protein